jgi:TIR domain
VPSSRIYYRYSPADELFARQVSALLAQRGYRIYDPYVSPKTEHQEMLAQSDAIIFFLSPVALQIPDIQGELQSARALSKAKTVIIVTAAPIELPSAFSNIAMISITGRSLEDVVRELTELIEPYSSFDWLEREIDRSPSQDQRTDEPAPPPAAPTGGAGRPLPPPAPAGPPAAGAPPFPYEEPAGVPPSSSGPWSAPPSPVRRSPPREKKEESEPAATIIPQPASPIAGGVDGTAPASTLQFAAYYPNTVPITTWNTLLIYSYVAEMLAQIEADAATFTELGSNPQSARGVASRAVQTGVELTVEPHIDGVTFSPASDSFIWRGNWHRSLFRFSGDATLAGQTVTGWIDIYAGSMVPIGRIDISLPFLASNNNPSNSVPIGMRVTSNIYDTVFISYSHRDRGAFVQACDEYKRFGIKVYTDEQLEAGADYERELSAMVDAAQVFHLLWSRYSASSGECRKEWSHALQRESAERFIKPWYWQKPLVTPPSEFATHHISFRYQRLKRKWWNPKTWL